MAAGVSTSVVSLVVNRKDAGRVTPDTRRRVLDAAQRLGYRIDGRGRSLATGRTGIVGFVAPDSTTPYFAGLQRGLLDAINPDYHLLTAVTGLGSEVGRDSIDRLIALGVDALIVVASDTERIASIRPTCPVLLLDSPGPASPFPRINLDVGSSARAIGRHLAELGHRSVAYLDADTGGRSMEQRRAALLASFRRHAAGARTTLTRCAIDVAIARDAVLRCWPSWAERGVSAIACGSDLHAFGAIGALRELGLAVPGDVSVTGADDQPISTVVRPALTTVRLPSGDLARLAGEHVRRVLTGGPPSPDLLVLDTEVVIRDSTGPAPGHVR